MRRAQGDSGRNERGHRRSCRPEERRISAEIPYCSREPRFFAYGLRMTPFLGHGTPNDTCFLARRGMRPAVQRSVTSGDLLRGNDRVGMERNG